MRIPYYGIYIVSSGVLEMYHLVNTSYERMTPNEGGTLSHYSDAGGVGIMAGNLLE